MRLSVVSGSDMHAKDTEQQLHHMPAHVLVLGVCASLTPRDVCNVAMTSKHLHHMVVEYEAAIASVWLASLITPSSLRLEHPMCALRCLHRNLLLNGDMDAPLSSQGIPMSTIALNASPTGPRAKLFGWTITHNAGSGWAWQPLRRGKISQLPRAAAPITPSTPSTSWVHAVPDPGRWCDDDVPLTPDVLVQAGEIVSSYRWCEMVQEVDLVGLLHRGGTTVEEAHALLDAAPRLRFSVDVGSHSGCRAEYLVTVRFGGCMLMCITFLCVHGNCAG